MYKSLVYIYTFVVWIDLTSLISRYNVTPQCLLLRQTESWNWIIESLHTNSLLLMDEKSLLRHKGFSFLTLLILVVAEVLESKLFKPRVGTGKPLINYFQLVIKILLTHLNKFMGVFFWMFNLVDDNLYLTYYTKANLKFLSIRVTRVTRSWGSG
jgi:hypothetical protein